MEENNNISYQIKGTIKIFHEICMPLVDKERLKKQRVEVGVILFFIGSIDNLCQIHKFDDSSTLSIKKLILGELGFNTDIASKLLKNFYTNQKIKELKFAVEACTFGGNAVVSFLKQDELCVICLIGLVKKWSKDEKLSKEEESILLN